jgi:hypothetical protein
MVGYNVITHLQNAVGGIYIYPCPFVRPSMRPCIRSHFVSHVAKKSFDLESECCSACEVVHLGFLFWIYSVL